MQVINLRTLKPIDRDTIVKSIKKTHRVVSAEEGWPQCGIGAELIAIATEECFDDLDAPPERVTGAEVPMPYAANLEAAALPQASGTALLCMHSCVLMACLHPVHSTRLSRCRSHAHHLKCCLSGPILRAPPLAQRDMLRINAAQ